MRPHRLIVALGLVVLLAAPGGLAQAGPSVETEATAEDRPIEEASPIGPGTPISVSATVSTPTGNDTEWRAFLNATLEGTDETLQANWTGSAERLLEASFAAPDEEGTYAVTWRVLVQSRNASDPGSGWEDANLTRENAAFQVRQPQPPPSSEDVSVTVRTGGGHALGTLGNLTPNEPIILDANVSLPQRDNTQWNVTLQALVDGTRVAEGQSVGTGGGSLPFVLQFNAPGATGTHELVWRATVEYRDAGEEDWTELTTREASSTFAVQTLQVPEEPGLPWGWILAVGAVAIAGAGGAYYALREPRQIKGEPRSQAMQDLEAEESGRESEPDEPQAHPQIKILEARAEDLRRMIDLAQERHEQGEITEHQYEQIKERKESELEDVEEEIEEHRQESGE